MRDFPGRFSFVYLLSVCQESIPNRAIPVANRIGGNAVLEYRPTETLPGPQRDVARPAGLCLPRRLAAEKPVDPPLQKPSSQPTLRWREVDSNFPHAAR